LLKVHFKLVEDGFGKIDYYNRLPAALAPKKLIREGCRKYITTQSDQSMAEYLSQGLTGYDSIGNRD